MSRMMKFKRTGPANFCLMAIALTFGVLMATLAFAAETPQTGSVTPVEYNLDLLVKQAAIGIIHPPGAGDPPYRINPDGELFVLPGSGSITYNFRAGDSAIQIAGDHVEPAVSLYNPDARESRGLNTLGCIGNQVKVVGGDAKGAVGYVIGKHGGAEHVMVDFPDSTVFDKLIIEDKMQVTTYGVGLEMTNVEGVEAMNMSPRLMDALNKAGMGVTAEGKLRIPVTHRVPAKIMGSGLGRNHVYRGDYDIQLFDEEVNKEYNLDTLRFSDLVAIIDADNTYGRIFRTGAISVGVIAHSRSNSAGHGPGVTTLFTSASGNIELVIDPNANLANLLGLR